MSTELDTVKSLIAGTKNDKIKWSPLETSVVERAVNYDSFYLDIESAFSFRYDESTLIIIYKAGHYVSEEIYGTVQVTKLEISFTDNDYKQKFNITMDDLAPSDHYLWVLFKEIEKQRSGAKDIMKNVIKDFKVSEE